MEVVIFEWFVLLQMPAANLIEAGDGGGSGEERVPTDILGLALLQATMVLLAMLVLNRH